VRVYVAATLADLARWHAAGAVAAGGERFVAEDESEEAEYAALVAAAAASASLSGDARSRRVVVVGDVTDEEAAIPWGDVAAVHADADEGADPDDDLGWYATQEVPDLLV
jgi:hypothetical protein